MSRTSRLHAATGYHRSTQADLYWNFLPVAVSADTFSGGLLAFKSSEQLKALRADHSETHVFHRMGDEIACVPLTPQASSIGKPTMFRTNKSASLVRRLVQDALIRAVVSWDYLLAGFDPPMFVVRQPSHDLLAKAVGDAAPLVSGLHVYPQYALRPRVLYGRKGPEFGVLVGFKTRREIDRLVAELLADGLDMEGRYVLAEDKSLLRDLRLDPATRRHAEGCVERVIDGRLILRDAPRLAELPADQVWLEARRENMDAVVRLSGVPDPQGILRRLDQDVFGLVGAKGRYELLIDIAGRLKSAGPFPLADGLLCTVDAPAALGQGVDGGTYRKFGAPTFVFDPAGSKTAWKQDKGLEEFGPFDAEFFTPKRPHIAVVTPDSFQGDVEVFLRKFKQGVPRAATFAQGFVRKYRLSDCIFHIESFDPGVQEAAAYRQACLNALTSDPKPHLAFVVIQEEHKRRQAKDDPYLVAKSTFMSQGVPVQEVLIETIRVPPHQEKGVPYTLSSIALACYAKLGGIPFVISAAQSLAHELVIGIGSASLRDGRLSGEERLVGITTVFTADGNYLLSNTSREAPLDRYPEELLATLRATVEQIKARNAWQPGDSIRLVFHVFKPLKDVEAQAVKQLVEGLVSDYQVEFAFVHLSKEHEWVLFDRNSEGVKDWQVADIHLRGQRKGEFVPERGYAVPLGKSEILLSVTGPRALVTPLQGAPRPLLLKLHRESTFQDLEYLAAQAFRFTSLSWRSLFPSDLPVTILYSDLIASLLGRLRHVRNWNPDILSTMLRNSRWFL